MRPSEYEARKRSRYANPVIQGGRLAVSIVVMLLLLALLGAGFWLFLQPQ